MILNQHQSIFIHIPKTGGTSIEKFFNMRMFHRTGKHDSAAKLRKTLDELTWAKYFKFSFVRNPWDRMVSYYHWRLREPENVDVQGCTFKDWLRFLHAGDFQKLTLNGSFKYGIKPQFEMLSIGEAIAVDFVGRFENLQQDFEQICQRIGIEPQVLPHKNAMNRSHHYTQFYDEESRILVEDLYRRDIEYFGYEFGA